MCPTTTDDASRPDLPAYERLASLVRALSSPVRLQILESLAQCPRSVEALAEVCGHPLKNISHHLQKLRGAGLVERNARGRKALYSLAGGHVAELWSHLTAFANARDADARRPEDDPGQRLSTAALWKLLEDERVTVIDVRPTEEYEAGHVPGALSVPLDRLEEHVASLPGDRLIAAICRGPFCRLADAAVSILNAGGRSAVRIEGGMLEWQAEGRSLDHS